MGRRVAGDGARDHVRAALPNRIVRPVFVIAPPRSGSTALFECLARFPELVAFTDREAEHVWWRVLPYEARRVLSDHIDPDELGPSRRRLLRGLLYREATRASAVAHGRTRRNLAERLSLRPIRYLDKTISNCLHLDVIAATFPDAAFVWLVREPHANIASMIEGWPQLERFGKRALTPRVRAHPDASVPHWTYPAPPGWEEVLGWSLPDICAWSWSEHVRAALAFFARTSMPVHRLTYEAFTADPRATVSDLARALGLRWTPAIDAHLASNPASRTTVTVPDPGKWRRHEAELRAAEPLFADAAAAAGYAV